MKERTKVLVIGLDGATWNVIKSLVKEGKLPTIANLMNNGCYGDLESSIPFFTIPAWKCYSAGKNPGKLGVYSTLGVDMEKGKFFFPNSISFKTRELWDYLGENNITCGVFDMPTTHPCKQINGFMVSHGAPRLSGYTYPEYLEEELKNRFNYKIDPDYAFAFGEDANISSTKELINQRFDVVPHLLKKFDPSFLHATIFNIDTIQHYYWRDMEEGDAKYGKVIEDFWTLIDNRIKGLLDEFRQGESYTILMSDHGFTAKRGEFDLIKWLIEKNLLKLKRAKLPLSGLLLRLSLSRDNVFALIGRTKIAPFLRSHVPREILVKVAALFPVRNLFDITPLGDSVDWGRSRVIPNILGPLYINRNAFDSQGEYEKFREALIMEIKEIEEPKTGRKLAREVRKREEIYFGEYVDDAPDLTLVLNEGYAIAGTLRSKEMWNYPTRGVTGVHKPQGIFLACGPGIKKNVELEGAKIYDLAPTILHIFGIPIPKDMDGRVLKEMFKEDSALAKREVEYQEVDEKARVREKIRELKAFGKI